MSLRGPIFGTVIYTRDEIGLRPPRSTTSIPRVEGTSSHYAGPSDWRQAGIDRSSPARFRDTTDHARCAAIMRAHQAFHMGPDRGWQDYAYSGAFCPHGYGYVGRGRGVRTAANGTADGNNRSYALQYMGAGEHDPLTVEAKRAAIDMAAYLGQPLRWEHSDWKPTACSGPQIRPWRRAGFPRPAGAPAPKTPTKEWDEMASKKEIQDAVRSVVRDEVGRALDARPGALLAVRDGWQTGDPVYLTDLASWKVEIRHEGPLHNLHRFFAAVSGRDQKALRLDPKVLAEIPTISG